MNVAFEGQFNVLSAINKSDNVKRFIYASSSEVYQQPTIIPTPEEVPLIVPDINNNCFSYGGGKIIGELTTKHYLKPEVEWQIFRPHNILWAADGERPCSSAAYFADKPGSCLSLALLSMSRVVVLLLVVSVTYLISAWLLMPFGAKLCLLYL